MYSEHVAGMLLTETQNGSSQLARPSHNRVSVQALLEQ